MARILVVDDDPQVRKLLVSFLERDGHMITTAANGLEARRWLDGLKMDLIITDIVMPEADGFELIGWMRNLPDHPRIIAISGGSSALDKGYLLTVAQHLAADKVLPKPVSYETMKLAVHEVLACANA